MMNLFRYIRVLNQAVVLAIQISQPAYAFRANVVLISSIFQLLSTVLSGDRSEIVATEQLSH